MTMDNNGKACGLQHKEYEETLRKYREALAILVKEKPRYKWDEDLIWCPSQLYLYVGPGEEKPYTLYLRYDMSGSQWYYYIIKKVAGKQDLWIEIKDIPYFKDNEYKAAEAYAEYWYDIHKEDMQQLFKLQEDKENKKKR